MNIKKTFLPALGLFGLFSTVTFATPITGDLRISGQATVSNSALNFLCEPSSGLTCNEATQGNFFAGTNQGGSFSVVSNSFGWIKDLNSVAQPIGAAFPGGPLMDFITFSVRPDYHLDLTGIANGSFSSAQCGAPPAPGQVCTPPGSAFNLVNGASVNGVISSTATFQLSGNAYAGTMSSGFSVFTGTVSADFNVPYQTILAQLASNNGTGTITAPYSARFTATAVPAVPEPGTTALMLGGLLVVSAKMLRRKSS